MRSACCARKVHRIHSHLSSQTHKKHHVRLLSQLTSEEAGRRANQLAQQESSSSPTTHNHLNTLLAHAGMESSMQNAPMSPPLHLATTHTRPADGVYLAEDSKYGRMDNATRLLLEKTVYQLESLGLSSNLDSDADAEDSTTLPPSFAFSSGMMAVTALILAHTGPITVILPDDVYHGVPTVLNNVFVPRHNVTIAKVDMMDTDNVIAVVEETPQENDVIVWMETPSNPLCKVLDIAAICQQLEPIKQSRSNITTVVDGTMVSPIITRPLELGADVSMHSGTKYLAGHSDALLGVLTTSPQTQRGQELAPILRSVLVDTGGVASAMDSWLTLRGLRTLHVRVERQSQTAMAVAQFLDQHESVSAVHYPGLSSHPNHSVAKKQMMNGMFGGVLSLEMNDQVEATALAAALQTIQRATSLGGTETLIEHRASIEPPGRVTSPQGLLRMSCGLEEQADIIRDLDRAIAIAKQVTSG
mmetsp:Transcript_37528/g.91029  ORF Transcript_37528/g.91029 Transcript_37528/m.91029 type:complete len:473 (+) Transcript_37528:21-1439(+)